MKLGAYTACLHDQPLGAMLDTLAALGLPSVEVNSGGFIPSPHCPVDTLLASQAARRDYLAEFDRRDMELTALNCNGNPLNPLPGVGPKHADDLRRSIRLAGLLGVDRVVSMSGTPGSDPDAKYPSWVVNAWDGVYLDVLDYQWSVALPFWAEIDQLARECGVKVALELHPHNLAFNAPTIERLVRDTGATHIGVEMDTSHLMWQQMDVAAVIRRLGPLVIHAAAKDVSLFDGVKTKGVLDNEFRRVPADDPGKVPTGYGHWCNAWPEDPAWRFVAVGVGHDVDYWVEILTALSEIDPDMAINIEHEDASMPVLDGLRVAAETLQEAHARLSAG